MTLMKNRLLMLIGGVVMLLMSAVWLVRAQEDTGPTLVDAVDLAQRCRLGGRNGSHRPRCRRRARRLPGRWRPGRRVGEGIAAGRGMLAFVARCWTLADQCGPCRRRWGGDLIDCCVEGLECSSPLWTKMSADRSSVQRFAA